MIINGSHLITYLSDHFLVIDFYNQQIETYDFNKIDRHIVYVDDEILCDSKKLQLFLQFTENKKSSCWIVKIEYIYQILKSKGYNVIMEPYFHLIDDLLGLKKSGIDPIVSEYHDKIYFNLNRNCNTQRKHTIEYLKNYNLLKYGYVTCNYLQDNSNRFLIKDNLTHYTANTTGFERCEEGSIISSNVKNFYYIAKKPGYISVVVESGCYPDYFKKFFPTEKTLIPFITRRIPIVLGDKDRLKDLENDGLDIFRDLINHSYDDLDYHDIEKSKSMISSNLDILKNKINIDNYTNRLQKNYEFISDNWLKVKLKDLINRIEKQS